MKKCILILLIGGLFLCSCTAEPDENVNTDIFETESVSETRFLIPSETMQNTSVEDRTSESEKIDNSTSEIPAASKFNPAGESVRLIKKTRDLPDYQEMISGGKALSSEELTVWNTYFEIANRLSLHFLFSDYRTPEEISMLFLLHDGIFDTDENGYRIPQTVSQEELKLLEERFERWKYRPEYADEWKMGREQIDATLKRYIGLSLDQTEKRGMLTYYQYLPETDAYYYLISEDYYLSYRMTEGAILDDGTLLLHWILIEDEEHSQVGGKSGYVSLKLSKDDWQIVSNMTCEQYEFTQPFICYYKGALKDVQDKVMESVRNMMKEAGLSNQSECWLPFSEGQVLCNDESFQILFCGQGGTGVSEIDKRYESAQKELAVLCKDPDIYLESAVLFVPWDQAPAN